MTTKKQWHPVFAELLRPLVESHYQMDTNFSVGDVPRQADFVLLRRTRAGQLPVAGLWRNLARGEQCRTVGALWQLVSVPACQRL